MDDLKIEFEWENAPERGSRGGGPLPDPRLAAMRANPKRWLVWRREGSPGGITYLNLSHPGFEFVSRNLRQVGDRKRVSDIYGRFVGDPE